MTRNTIVLDSVDKAVDSIIDTIGKDIRIGMPLGLGKPNQLINSLYARAKADPSIQLTILTALSLEKPTWKSDAERRFLQPFVERLFGDCPSLDYAIDTSNGNLPPNVMVKEFFYRPGSRLKNAHAQHQYISSNYTHAARDVFANGCNVAAQVIGKRDDSYSLSCNPDTGPELIEMLEAAGRPHMVIGQVNEKLPFMVNDAEVPASDFDIVIENKKYNTKLFGTPKGAVTTPDYMIGLNASALIKDGGTLQVGIGALGDAIVYGAILRHKDPALYQKLLKETGISAHSSELIDEIGGTEPFEKGLYGATEMFVDGFMDLYKAGILKRNVYDFWALQQLLNDGRITETSLGIAALEGMEELGVRVLRTKDFERLQYHGFLRDDCSYDQGSIIAADGERINSNLADPDSRKALAEKCLGTELRNGVILHGGFFLGANAFYDDLNAMPEEERARICMSGVNKINQLDENPRLYKTQRVDARFINTGLMATMSGAVVSDGLETGQVVSGVGGQYNFVAMAHQLPTGRSILMVRSVREKGGEASSNVVWNYGHCTIPRHLRDIVITEYGIAELRSKTDSDVIKALLNITDSRFQEELLETAKEAGKIESSYFIPAEYRNNSPERLNTTLASHKRNAGLFPAFPFGCDLTPVELVLAKALKGVKGRTDSKRETAQAVLEAIRINDIPEKAKPYLERMDLMQPTGLQDRLLQRLLVLELEEMGKL